MGRVESYAGNGDAEPVGAVRLEMGPSVAVLDLPGKREVLRQGQEKLTALYDPNASTASPEYLRLHRALTKTMPDGQLLWKGESEIDAQAVEALLNGSEGEDFLHGEASGSKQFVSQTVERKVEDPELLTEKDVSKKFLGEDRAQLAREIREARNSQRQRLAQMKRLLESAPKRIDDEKGGDKIFVRISSLQGAEATMTAERIASEELTGEAEAQAETQVISGVIDNSEAVNRIKKKLQEHYAKAGEMAGERFESLKKTVEQTMRRNDVFIVHTLLLDEELRHNDRSNISSRATLEDDLDILLSLEPSISTSSIKPGSQHGLWSERIGVLLGGGDIMGVKKTDDGTTPGGIKRRFGEVSSSEVIDAEVSNPSSRGYNELVVDNPKVFGFFQRVTADASGVLRGFDPAVFGGRTNEARADFMKYMNLAMEKGLPSLVMTQDRRMFEFVSIDKNGIVSVGQEITPEQVAQGNAGFSRERRREIGERVVSNNLFRHAEHQRESKGIVAELAGEGSAQEVQFSQEEYAEWLQHNPDRFNELPKNLLDDKEFMLAVAPIDPVSAYENCGESLKRDIDFITQLYSLKKTRMKSSMYDQMPEELRMNESVAKLAIKNGDYQSIDASFADSPGVWEDLVNRVTQDLDPSQWFTREVGKSQMTRVNLFMKSGGKSIDFSERIIADPGFMRQLAVRYGNFKFERDRDELMVTRLG